MFINCVSKFARHRITIYSVLQNWEFFHQKLNNYKVRCLLGVTALFSGSAATPYVIVKKRTSKKRFKRILKKWNFLNYNLNI